MAQEISYTNMPLFPEIEASLNTQGKKKVRRQSKEIQKPTANYINNEFIKKTDKSILKDRDVFKPCLDLYNTRTKQAPDPIVFLENLTGPLVGALKDTKALIENKMRNKWKGKPDEAINLSISNSLRRTAGTNYQSLVSYALAKYLLAVNSSWYVSHPIPKEFKEALTIIFTGGVPIQPEEVQALQEITDEKNGIDDAKTADDEASLPVVRVQPDVDLLLRNEAWQQKEGIAEPVVMLSLKTSLVDRAGMAARWKIYFDLATHPCCHQEEQDCAYRQLGIQMENANQYDIHHGIVTANIYKLNYHDERYRKGELNSGQTKSNTYMFELKLTTRDDQEAETPAGWYQLPHIIDVLKQLSNQHNLPS